MPGLRDRIICGHALAELEKMEPATIDLVLTDPPYFLDKFDDGWDPKVVSRDFRPYAVETLVPGMKFDRSQGILFYEWFSKVAKKIYRVMKPGGFLFVFSSPRLYHRLASSADDAGFAIRDCFIWLYTQNQPKAMSLNHFIKRLKIPKDEKERLIKALDGWKTPQIKTAYEPILVAQKPHEGTLLQNFSQFGVGLFNTKIKVGLHKFPANVLLVEGMEHTLDRFFLIPKPDKREKGRFNTHKTVKPLTVCKHLIELASLPGALVLDPFAGSGTTCVAAKMTGMHFVGIEIIPEYVDIARQRLAALEPRKAAVSTAKLPETPHTPSSRKSLFGQA
jgi:site-specific DNA-methyltransferase (adenine-specific)